MVPLQGSGLAENALVREGFREALQTQVAIPLRCKRLVLFMQFGQKHVVIANDIAAPLLNSDIVIAPILCEAPDYVE